jgi:hypothetical protein
MAQNPIFYVLLPVVGIYELAVGGFSNGINSKVAAGQVLFERNVGAGVHHKTFVAPATLTLRSRERVLLFAPGMQKYREISAHLHKVQSQQLLLGGSNHDPITVGASTTQQLVTHGAADQVALQLF